MKNKNPRDGWTTTKSRTMGTSLTVTNGEKTTSYGTSRSISISHGVSFSAIKKPNPRPSHK